MRRICHILAGLLVCAGLLRTVSGFIFDYLHPEYVSSFPSYLYFLRAVPFLVAAGAVETILFIYKNDSASKVRGLRAGADDYLTKPFDMDELIARIVSLIRRYTRFNQQDGISQQLEFDGLKIDIENRSVTTENGTFELPPKEFDLLLYCAKNQGKILTKQQIYEEVWREEYFYDDSNIMAIISRLRKKLEVNPGSPKYIQTIKGIGYRFNKEV